MISRIDPEAFEACFRRWIASVVEHTEGELIAIDGKTLRGSYDRDDDKAALCMVSAWASVAVQAVSWLEAVRGHWGIENQVALGLGCELRRGWQSDP